MKTLETLFEGSLWNSRLIVLLAVIGSIGAAFGLFYVAIVDTWYMLSHLTGYASPELGLEARMELRRETVAQTVQIVDGFLLATFMVIFGMGLYELFISRIDQAASAETASKVLAIHSLDDLKTRLAKVVLMILVVRFFEYALGMNFATPFDLLQFGGGIALVGLALYLAHLSDQKH
ncbi:MAG TPA: YqhA family protein [Sedimenticola thiotaurini]|uniref:YqhA family protein n=1 Tax=Sedimenticola thiotaurini TaxID=1543721 RepID=A0A831RIR2_9GAMM|nr:YqhA family protein [Sedimenticola thiotaurini]